MNNMKLWNTYRDYIYYCEICKQTYKYIFE